MPNSRAAVAIAAALAALRQIRAFEQVAKDVITIHPPQRVEVEHQRCHPGDRGHLKAGAAQHHIVADRPQQDGEDRRPAFDIHAGDTH